MSDRHITRRIRGTDTSDGAGVKLKRIIGQAGGPVRMGDTKFPSRTTVYARNC
jgi:hypothetical protein